MAINWNKLLGPDGRRRLRRFKRDRAKFMEMSDAAFAEALEYHDNNSQPCKYPAGEPVYDAVVRHVLIPEAIRRLRMKYESK